MPLLCTFCLWLSVQMKKKHCHSFFGCFACSFLRKKLCQKNGVMCRFADFLWLFFKKMLLPPKKKDTEQYFSFELKATYKNSRTMDQKMGVEQEGRKTQQMFLVPPTLTTITLRAHARLTHAADENTADHATTGRPLKQIQNSH